MFMLRVSFQEVNRVSPQFVHKDILNTLTCQHILFLSGEGARAEVVFACNIPYKLIVVPSVTETNAPFVK